MTLYKLSNQALALIYKGHNISSGLKGIHTQSNSRLEKEYRLHSLAVFEVLEYVFCKITGNADTASDQPVSVSVASTIKKLDFLLNFR